MRRALVLCAAVAALSVQVSVVAVPATAQHRPARPDLVVPTGAVTASGATLTGSFTVKDRGGVHAGRSRATLFLVSSGADRPLARYAVRGIRPGRSRTIAVSAVVPAGLTSGSRALVVCADSRRDLRERSERNNCRTVGRLDVGPAGTVTASTVPTAPVPYEVDAPFVLSDPLSTYWVSVSASYDASHQTPTELFVWLHGCGGYAKYDIYDTSPGGQDQSWISVAVGGAEGECWDVDHDAAKVLAAIADVETHFNIDPRRVVVGGYSSGGDLAYRTAFYNARTFAGVLAENSSPFRDTGSSASASIAAAAWRFHAAHLAHLQDDTYPISTVRAETDAMSQAGFPVQRIERPGTHYDDPGTIDDLQDYLLPFLDAGWRSP